jgi:hypothetical protein
MTTDFDINVFNRGAWETDGAGPDQWVLCPFQIDRYEDGKLWSTGNELDHFNLEISEAEVKVLMMGFSDDEYDNFDTSDDFWITATDFGRVFTSMPIRVRDWIDTVILSLSSD